MNSPKNIRFFISILGFIVLSYILWNVRMMIYFFFIATLLAFVARPLMRILDKLHLQKWRLPNTLKAGIVLSFIICTIVGLIGLLAPIIINQATIISKIDTAAILKKIEIGITNLPEWLVVYEPNLSADIQEEINRLINVSDLGLYLSNLADGLSSLIIGIFSVLFISFFLLKDGQIVDQVIVSLSPDKYLDKIRTIIHETKNLLSRYLIGVLAQVSVVIIIITVGLTILGIKNALLIGFIAGIFNIIPFLGPIMGAGIGILLAATSQVELTPDLALIGFIAKSSVPFIIAQLLDNFFLQPIIFSKSVKAHPLEIFMVILAAGSLGGILGMIIAVPTYSFIRIIAKEFFNGYKVVQGLTKDL